MKAARPFWILVLTVVVALAIAAMTASAGSQDNPEVTDTAEDSTTDRTSHDVVRAWVDDENSTITFYMEMTQLDAFSPRDDWRTLPTSIYEYYFTVEGKDYAARATIPVHGLFAAFAGFALYEVTYGSDDTMNYTSVDDSIPGTYGTGNNVISMTVNKVDVGEPSPGELVTHMWCAVFFQPRGGTKEQVDSAMSYTAAGRDYIITGSATHFYRITLRAQNVTVQAKPRESASFNITISSGSTTDVMVTLKNSTLPHGYYINFSLDMPVPVPQGGSASLMVLVRVPDNATNGTNVPFSIYGELPQDDDQTYRSDDLNLMIQVRFIPPKPPEKSETILTKLLDLFRENPVVVVAIIVIVVAAGVGYFAWDKYQRREEEDIMEYQAYLDSQRQQRDMGGI